MNSKSSYFYLFFATLAIYLCAAAGYVDTIDADPSISTSLALIQRGELVVFPPNPNPIVYQKAFKIRGGWYTKMGLAPAFLYTPFSLLGKTLAHSFGGREDVLVRFCASLLNCFLTALIVVFLFYIFISRGRSTKISLCLALSAGFATLLFPYSKTCQREPLEALCLLGAFMFPLQGAFALGGAAIAIGTLTKLAFILPALPAIVLTIFQCRGSKRNLSRFFIFIFLAVAIQMVFSKLAWGHIWETGYSKKVMSYRGKFWSTPFWTGIWVQTFSPVSGIFIYSPVLGLCFIALLKKAFLRSLTTLDIAIIFAALIQIVFHARWYDPLGGSCLGPRYTVILIPLFFLWLSSTEKTGGILKKSFILLTLAISLTMQIVNVAVKSQEHWSLETAAEEPIPIPHWKTNFIFFFHKWKTSDEKYRTTDFGMAGDKVIDLNRFPTLVGYNFWWAHLHRYGFPSKVP